MNNLIQELAAQAKIDVDARWANEEKAVYPEAHYRYITELNEAFAKSIVTMCIDICIVNNVAGKGAGESAFDIQELFGFD